MIAVEQLRRRDAGPSVALFRHGFRPFFLFAGVWAVIAMLVWIAALHGAVLPDGPLPIARWHAHEMIAGFVGAAISGFVLTAVPNWTGRRGYAGGPLILLVALFLAARLVLLPGSPVPAPAAAAIALLPLPALLLTVLPALVKAGAPRLYGPPALILVFWGGDALMLAEAAGWTDDTFATGQLLSLNVALALVGLIGGRIVPSFTLNALRRAGLAPDSPPFPWIDRAAMLALGAVVLGDLVAPDSIAAGTIAAVAAVATLARLARWHGLATLGQPILWVLHLAYLLVPAALATKAAFLLAGASWAAAWLHLQAAGGIALMIMAVMTRATLGHTGRDLVAPPLAVAAYGLIPFAALARAFGGEIMPYAAALAVAGTAWIAAFALYLIAFAPMLLAPRPDGKPG
ncbi:NnrS family protein [Elioraea sp.]|uniref:NnrS family protein n=1 Tax=Elioraea sp. TaxID=2185103 RepID=UPI0021DEF767|nr:NnrS family protein [Elioraea sp.]GIX11933.1 MAG: short-chain dehydrogenase [Elioraea sp.]